MTILSPTNKSVQDLKPDYKKALNKEAERFYVIYKGPHAGIHTDWGIAETFCKPKVQKIKEEHRDQRFDIPKDVEYEVNNPAISFEDFRTIWSKARAACPEDLIHERFFTTDKKTKSLYNFLEGADPRLIQQAFSAGLIDNIYPSCNLQELKFFPTSMIETIKNFRKKVLKAKDDPIYIRVISSLPEWIQEATLAPYHYLEIGLAKAKKDIEQSRPTEDKDLPFEEILHQNRINDLKIISKKIIEIISGSKKKVNYTNSHCIITSWSYGNTSNEDLERASKFGEQFMNNNFDASTTTRQIFCRHAE
ncbi:unnamed protein product [Lactuca virosa]|nr:unnamed protein product [Lactuca virosa]